MRANRLSADPHVRVLLLEAGQADRDPLIHMPGGDSILMKDGRRDRGYHTTPQPHLDGRSLFYPRGKVLGGSSATNAMVAVRGAAADYDRWRDLGLKGWGYPDVLPYLRRLESYGPHSNAFHGADRRLTLLSHKRRRPGAALPSPPARSLAAVGGHRLPDRRASHLHHDIGLGDAVLDRLEGADRLAKCVVRNGVARP